LPHPKVILQFPEETKRISVTSCFVRLFAVYQYLLSASLS